MNRAVATTLLGWLMLPATALATPWWTSTQDEAAQVEDALAELWPEADVQVVVGAPDGSDGVWYDGRELSVRNHGLVRRQPLQDDAFLLVTMARSWSVDLTVGDGGWTPEIGTAPPKIDDDVPFDPEDLDVDDPISAEWRVRPRATVFGTVGYRPGATGAGLGGGVDLGLFELAGGDATGFRATIGLRARVLLGEHLFHYDEDIDARYASVDTYSLAATVGAACPLGKGVELEIQATLGDTVVRLSPSPYHDGTDVRARASWGAGTWLWSGPVRGGIARIGMGLRYEALQGRVVIFAPRDAVEIRLPHRVLLADVGVRFGKR